MKNKFINEKAERFNELHHTGEMLVLPNIWDPLGAILLESLGYPAVATASASVAFANGYNDGERIPLPWFVSHESQELKPIRIKIVKLY